MPQSATLGMDAQVLIVGAGPTGLTLAIDLGLRGVRAIVIEQKDAFFFQAEDGIRDGHVTGVQTCALPIFENGENQQFKIPQGQKFMIDGRETDAWGLKKGMKVSAQRVTEVPETVVAQEIKRTGTAPPPPQAPSPDVPVLVVVTQPVPVQTAAAEPEPAPTKLPKTASDLPLVALLGTLFCGLSLMAMTIRVIFSRIAR